MNVLIIKDSLEHVQFKLQVEAPRSRIEKELVPALVRGGAEDGWTVVVEHVQEGGYAAIGSDGTRPVVWGVGDTAEEALSEAREEIFETCEPHQRNIELTAVTATGEQMGRIAAGEVSAQSLGLA